MIGALFEIHSQATAALPAPWLEQDIAAGSASYNATAQTFTVNGAGAIGGSSDRFQFVFQSTMPCERARKVTRSRR